MAEAQAVEHWLPSMTGLLHSKTQDRCGYVDRTKLVILLWKESGFMAPHLSLSPYSQLMVDRGRRDIFSRDVVTGKVPEFLKTSLSQAPLSKPNETH